MAVDKTPKGEGWLGALADWLSARTTLMLVLLMVQLGLLMALLPLFSGSAGQSGAPTGAHARPAAGSKSCSHRMPTCPACANGR